MNDKITFLRYLDTCTGKFAQHMKDSGGLDSCFEAALHNVGHLPDKPENRLFVVEKTPDGEPYVLWVEKTSEEWDAYSLRVGRDLAIGRAMGNLQSLLNIKVVPDPKDE